MYDDFEFELELRTELNELIASLLWEGDEDDENANDSEVDIIDCTNEEIRAKKIIATISVLSEFIGRLSVNYALLATNDPSMQNANSNYYNMLSHMIGKAVCQLAEKKSKELI